MQLIKERIVLNREVTKNNKSSYYLSISNIFLIFIDIGYQIYLIFIVDIYSKEPFFKN